MTEKILIIDDDEKLLKIVALTLESKGYVVFTAKNGEEGESLFHQIAPDLVILDVMMPGLKGWDVCQRLRQVSSVPIIFLTALGETNHLVRGLQTGADDYVAKPVRPIELEARVTALLRRVRMSHEPPKVLRFENDTLIINRAEQKAFVQGQEVSLSPTEYNLLLFMAERAGRILSTELIFDAIWGIRSETQMESVKWHIWRLRQKIETDPKNPRFILTERGKGYRFSPH
jgi:two-component system, OmpR family, KDP operon response regulator KdpE